MPDCKHFTDKIDLYIDGELSGTELLEFKSHVSSCENCRKELEYASSLRKNLKSLDLPNPPDDLSEKINARLDSEDTFEHYPPLYKRLFNKRTYSSIAACLLIAAFLGINNNNELTDNLRPTQSPLSDKELTFSTLAPTKTDDDLSSDSEVKEKAAPKKKAIVTPTAEPKTDQPEDYQSQGKRLKAPKVASEENIDELNNIENSDINPDETALSDSEKEDNSTNSTGYAMASNIEAMSDENDNIGTLLIDGDKLSEVTLIADKYVSQDAGVYTMSHEQYISFINELDSAQIKYEAYTPVNENIQFTIDEINN